MPPKGWKGGTPPQQNVEDILDATVSGNDTTDEYTEPQTLIYMQTTDVQEVIVPVKRTRTRLNIRPYTPVEEVRVEKMGLDEQGYTLFPGTHQVDRIGMESKNGYYTYFTGLDEGASEIQSIENKEQKFAKVRALREVIAFLENSISSNYLVNKATCMDGYGTKDDIFWANVKTFHSTGSDRFDAKGGRIPTYWDGVELTLSNDGVELDLTKGRDLIVYHAILASGLSMVAPSLQWAINKPVYNFYLDMPEETTHIRTEYKKLRNKAGGYLDLLLDDQAKLFFLCKLLAPINSLQYHRGGPSFTVPDQMYEDLCNYIDGKLGDDARLATERFLEYHNMPIDVLKRRAIVKDAAAMHVIEPKGDGNLYYIKKNIRMGKTIEDIVAYLENTLNSEVWDEISEKVEKIWAS